MALVNNARMCYTASALAGRHGLALPSLCAGDDQEGV
jgi:hypothetical protein